MCAVGLYYGVALTAAASLPICLHLVVSATEVVDTEGRVCDPLSIVLSGDDFTNTGDPLSSLYDLGCCPASPSNSVQHVADVVSEIGESCFASLPLCISSCLSSGAAGRQPSPLRSFHRCVLQCRHGPKSTVHQHEYRRAAHHCHRTK